MRGRPALPIGEYGNIHCSGSGKDWTALCRYRDTDGATRRVTASGTSKNRAILALKDKIKSRGSVGGVDITPDTTVAVLAEAWFATLASDGASTRDVYRHQLDRHIIPRIGSLRIREATTARLDGFLRTVAEQRTEMVTHPTSGKTTAVKVGGPTPAKQSRVALSLMFGMASRYDAVPANPVSDTRLERTRREPTTAMSVEQFVEFRESVIAWASEKKSREQMLDVVDLFIATGLRPGELLAVQHSDVDLKERVLKVTGTVKRDSVNGLHRQAYPKTKTARQLTLPDFAVSMLRRRKLATGNDLVFPNRKGTVLEPANFRRTWREARGEEWAWVEARAFRRAVATLIERESGSVIASQQLGHSSDAVTKKHYIQDNDIAPDSTAILNRFRKAD